MFVVPAIRVPEPNANPAAPYSTLAIPDPKLSVQPKSAASTVMLVAVKAVGSVQVGFAVVNANGPTHALWLTPQSVCT